MASTLFDLLVKLLRDRGVEVQTGRFGAFMRVEIINDGPVALVIEIGYD